MSFTGGEVLDNEAPTGGGLYAVGCDFAFDSTYFDANVADDNGGALYAYGESLTLDSAVIANNKADYGGGLYLSGDVDAVVTDSLLITNYATGFGGAVRLRDGTLTVTSSNLGATKNDNSPDDVYANSTAYEDYDTSANFICSDDTGCL